MHRSWNGEHYLMHDMTLGRTTNGWDFIFLRTSAYLDGLDAGSWFSEQYVGEPIPRLDTYLRWIKGKAKVYLDVKTGNLEEIVALIRELGMEKKGRPKKSRTENIRLYNCSSNACFTCSITRADNRKLVA